MKPIKQIRAFRRSGKCMSILASLFAKNAFQKDIALPEDDVEKMDESAFEPTVVLKKRGKRKNTSPAQQNEKDKKSRKVNNGKN